MHDTDAPMPDDRPDLDVMVATVGLQIKALRKQADLTLDELSRRSGISTGLISQIERGKGNPSFASLVQIAHGLDVPIGRLLHLAEQVSPVVRAHERRSLDFHGADSVNGDRYELLTPSLNGALEVLWVVTQPGHDTSATARIDLVSDICPRKSAREPGDFSRAPSAWPGGAKDCVMSITQLHRCTRNF